MLSVRDWGLVVAVAATAVVVISFLVDLALERTDMRTITDYVDEFKLLAAPILLVASLIPGGLGVHLLWPK